MGEQKKTKKWKTNQMYTNKEKKKQQQTEKMRRFIYNWIVWHSADVMNEMKMENEWKIPAIIEIYFECDTFFGNA